MAIFHSPTVLVISAMSCSCYICLMAEIFALELAEVKSSHFQGWKCPSSVLHFSEKSFGLQTNLVVKSITENRDRLKIGLFSIFTCYFSDITDLHKNPR